MRKLYYAGGSIIISDQVCKSILRYGRALARSGSSDLVVLPAFTENFGKGVAHILLGPASQMLSVPTAEFDIDLADAHMVEILESRTKELDPDRLDEGAVIVAETPRTAVLKRATSKPVRPTNQSGVASAAAARTWSSCIHRSSTPQMTAHGSSFS